MIYERINRRPKVIFADEGYTSHELAELYEKQGTRIEVVKKDKSKGIKDEKRGFAIGPKRWIVERTFAWIGKFRRFSKDYELLLTSSSHNCSLVHSHLIFTCMPMLICVYSLYPKNKNIRRCYDKCNSKRQLYCCWR